MPMRCGLCSPSSWAARVSTERSLSGWTTRKQQRSCGATVEEAAHARRALKALGIKLGRDVEPTPDMLVTDEVRLPRSLDKLWPALVQGEIEGGALYQRWADNENDPEVQRLLRLSGREETLHAGRVEQALSLLEVTV